MGGIAVSYVNSMGTLKRFLLFCFLVKGTEKVLINKYKLCLVIMLRDVKRRRMHFVAA